MYQRHKDTDRTWINNYGAVFREGKRESSRQKEWARTLSVIEQGLATDMRKSELKTKRHQARSLYPVIKAEQAHFAFNSHLGSSESHAPFQAVRGLKQQAASTPTAGPGEQ